MPQVTVQTQCLSPCKLRSRQSSIGGIAAPQRPFCVEARAQYMHTPQLAVFNLNLNRTLRTPLLHLSSLLPSSRTTRFPRLFPSRSPAPPNPTGRAMAPVAGFVPDIISNVLRSPFLRKGNKTPRKGAATEEATASSSVPQAGSEDATALQSSPRVATLDNTTLSASVEVGSLFDSCFS